MTLVWGHNSPGYEAYSPLYRMWAGCLLMDWGFFLVCQHKWRVNADIQQVTCLQYCWIIFQEKSLTPTNKSKTLTNTPPYLSITYNALSQNWTQRLLPVKTKIYRMIQDEYFISSTICKSKNRMGWVSTSHCITLQHGTPLTLVKKVHLSVLIVYLKSLKTSFFKMYISGDIIYMN